MKRKINLVIAGTPYPLTVYSDREEELFRKAAKQINDKLNQYRVRFPKEGVENILAMISIDFAFQALNLEDRNNTQPFKDKLSKLTLELEQVFENENDSH